MSRIEKQIRYRNGNRRRKLRARVIAAYDTCWICGKPIDKSLKTPHPMSPEVDEIIPVSRGGSPFDWNNCRLAHRICNEIKSNHTVTYARNKLKEREIQAEKTVNVKPQPSSW
ncbi:endonuclease [Alloscardovia theropitheci]|uniref:Endonuclease n=2 Tax=Alloscardovia theropitheci TaxID=2496842 RepID=A0A4R0QR55_9BIFI|nr:endonuclease [Alloscardovia theropitheci]